MLDIQGQPTMAAQPAVPQQAVPQPGATIPSVSGSTTKLVQWTLVAIVLAFALVGIYLSFVLSLKNSEVVTRNRDINTLTTELGTPNRVTAEKTANQLKLSVSALQASLSKTSPWSAFLKELTSRVPDSVVLTNLSTSDGFVTRINGTAKTYSDLAQFITALQASPKFSNVALESGAESDSQSGASVTFSLKATYLPDTSAVSASTTGGANGAQ